MDFLKAFLGLFTVIIIFTSLLFLSIWLRKKREITPSDTEAVVKATEKGKSFYQIGGPIIAWILFHIIWFIADRQSFGILVSTSTFWVFQSLLLVINLALLGMLGITIFFIRMVTILAMITTLIFLSFNFIEGGPELLAEIQNGLGKAVIEGKIAKIKTLDKERRVEPLLAKLEKLKAKAQKEPLSQSDQKELRQVEADLEKIHPSEKQDGKQKKDANHLSGILKPPADRTIVDKDENGRELWYEKWDQIQLQQLNHPPGRLTFINREKVPSWTTSQETVTSAPAVGRGKVELMSAAGKDLLVQVRIIPYFSRRRSLN